MPRTRGKTTKQIQAIRSYVRKGYSANTIQKKMKARHIGIRRTVLLTYVREFRRQPPKPSVAKYIPRKYRKGLKYPIIVIVKRVRLFGRHKGKRVRKIRTGRGSELYHWIRGELESGYWDVRPTIES